MVRENLDEMSKNPGSSSLLLSKSVTWAEATGTHSSSLPCQGQLLGDIQQQTVSLRHPRLLRWAGITQSPLWYSRKSRKSAQLHPERKGGGSP